MIAGLLGSSILPEHAEPRAGDVHASCADPRLAASALGFTARISVLDGLQETVAWYRDRAI